MSLVCVVLVCVLVCVCLSACSMYGMYYVYVYVSYASRVWKIPVPLVPENGKIAALEALRGSIPTPAYRPV